MWRLGSMMSSLTTEQQRGMNCVQCVCVCVFCVWNIFYFVFNICDDVGMVDVLKVLSFDFLTAPDHTTMNPD
jgi:hypothetical protein